MTRMQTRWSNLSRRSIGFGVAVAAAGALLSAAGYRSAEQSHPPREIQSLGHTYQCDTESALSMDDARGRDGELHVVGWVPVTHAVYAAHRDDPEVYLRFGHRFFPCQVDRVSAG